MAEENDIFTPEPLPDGFEIAGYRITRCLRGPRPLQAVCSDSSIIYVAQDSADGDGVVLKEYIPPMTVRAEDGSLQPTHGWNVEDFQPYVERFVRRVRMAARYKHPAIVPVREILRAGNTAIMVMPYVGDLTLRDAVCRKQIRTERQLYSLLRRLLEAVSVIHACGGLHGDIKPSNIVMDDDGNPVLIDTDSGMQMDCSIATVYTDGFSAPEQRCARKGAVFGPEADIYAIGATLKYLIYGSVTVAGRELIPCGMLLLTDLDKATEASPAARWRSAGEWLDALGAVDCGPLTGDGATALLPDPYGDEDLYIPPSETADALYPEEGATAITVFEDEGRTQPCAFDEDYPPVAWDGPGFPLEFQLPTGPPPQPLEELAVRTFRVIPQGWLDTWDLQVCEPLPPMTRLNGYTLLDVARYEHNAIAYRAKDYLGCECEIVEFTPSSECVRNGWRIEGAAGFDVLVLDYLRAMGRIGEIELDGAMPWHGPGTAGSELLFFANGTVYHWRERREYGLVKRLFDTLPEDPSAPVLYASALEGIVNALHVMHSRGVVHGNITFGAVFGDEGGISFSVPALGLPPAYAVDCSEPPHYFREEVPMLCNGADVDLYMVGAMFHYLLTGSFRRSGGHSFGLQTKQLLSDSAGLCRIFNPKWLETIDIAMNPEEERQGWPDAYHWLSALRGLAD